MGGLAVARPDPDSGPREREVIAAFADITTEAITATRLEDLLALVGQKLCHLLGVGRCSVYMRQDDGRFRGAAGWCGDDGNISAAVQAQEAGIPGDAFSREVIRSGAPVLISDVRNDPRPHRRTMEHWGVRAMLGVPLVFDGDVIGLIFVDNVAREHEYTDDEVALGELFGGLAALVVRQALQAARLAAQAEELDRQKRMLEFLADVHAKLTGAVLEGADIRAVVELLSDLAGAPVALLDEDFAVMTWTAPSALRAGPPSVGERARDRPALRTALADLSAARPSTVLEPSSLTGLGRRHVVCRLIVEGRPSGYLAVVEAGRALGDLDTKLAERGATVLALQVLSERRQIEAEGQARDDFLSDLLNNHRDVTQLARRGLPFGVDLTEPHVLVRLTVESGEGHPHASVARRLVVSDLALRLGTDEPPATTLPGAVVVLVRLGSATPDEVRAHVAAVADALVLRVRIRGGVVSAVCRGPEEFPRAHRELREIEELARSFGWSRRVVTVDELGLFRVVVSSGRVKEAVRFADELVRPVRDHDGADGALLPTWRAFLAAEARVQRAAADLGVHENTVRYRLGRIREITGKDPAALDTLLIARVAFQILELAGWFREAP
ncbi:sugar diacid utilization regulator [Actinomycetospora succinea]|uniref:Sugar diacid utilization regulator n=1 Tax=Actinomycetospora succinea TaxID=663603 RepID=A0A4R6VCA1_9PSEU|nr:GAF domain-containing protein [Actinomycetospora succinea]TDQ58294.1 sugar diacid utilization regulator [Actinomycetospora succinea]